MIEPCIQLLHKEIKIYMWAITEWAMDCRWGKRGAHGELEVWTVEAGNCRWIDVYANGSGLDGITVFPSSQSRSLVWDCTFVDTFAVACSDRSTVETGTAATGGEELLSSVLAYCSWNHGSILWEHWSYLEGNIFTDWLKQQESKGRGGGG